MGVGSDPTPVARHDEFKLRRALAARTAGDEAAARRWWSELVTDNFDRLRAFVQLHRGVLRSADEEQEALQETIIAVEFDMFANFTGEHFGEWVNYAKKIAFGKCNDVARKGARRTRHEKRLDEVDTEGRDTGGMDRDVYRAMRDQESAAEAAELDAELHATGAGFLDWALPQLSGASREVLELDREGATIDEMRERLGKKRDAIYQARSRGMRDLETLREEYES